MCRPRGHRWPAGRPIRRRWRDRVAGADAERGAGRVAAGQPALGARPRAAPRRPAPRGDGRLPRAARPDARRPAPTEPRVDEPAPLDKFLASLAARDASPHTQRAYRTAVGAYLAWLQALGTCWRAPSRTVLRAYLAELGNGRARSSVAQRLAAIRSFHRLARRAGLADADPWAALGTPRRPRRLPPVLSIADVERVVASAGEGTSASSGRVSGRGAARGSTTGGRDALRRSLALRDVAIVETAYAAGLRIAELAGLTLDNLDLGRGELRVLGKGRKERAGLLGRPARAAIAGYLAEGRPVLLGRARPGLAPDAVSLNARGAPLGERGMRYRLDAAFVRAGAPEGDRKSVV